MGMVFCLVALFGCNKKACERYCSCDDPAPSVLDDYYYNDYSDVAFGSVVPGSPDCQEECEEALDQEDVGCRGAFRRMARCLDQLDCDYDECYDPINEMEIECDF
jgi:hypothetical protein